MRLTISAIAMLLGAGLLFSQEAVVQRSTLWIDTAKRGTMLREVRGLGELAENRTAVLKIAETQARQIVVGNAASIDTRNGVVSGRVLRIAPVATEGTVNVTVQLAGNLPAGARQGLTVDGTVSIEELKNVVYVGRPVFGAAESSVMLFKLESDGRHATKVRVELGRSSVNQIEILEGLRESDQVILSDMSTWDSYDRVRLN